MAAAEKTRQSPQRCPVYVIHGDDALLRDEALAEVLADALGPAGDPLAIGEYNGETSELADVLDDLRTPSLLSGPRVVLVRAADAFVTAHRARLESYLESPGGGGTLILLPDSWPKSTRLAKLVARIGREIECDAPSFNDLPAWLATRARAAHRCTLEPDAARRLIELVGNGCARLDTELSKLATFVLPRERIAREDVETLVGAQREEKVFGICDALAARDARGALALWHQVLASDRDASFRAIGGLAWTVRRMATARRLVDQGMPAAAAVRQVGMYGNTALLASRITRFSADSWEGILRRLLRIDVGAKSGLADVEAAVETLIVELCAA
ncbi:MAG: DNA polymerase III subunit delta [Phycisphaerae bacterium]